MSWWVCYVVIRTLLMGFPSSFSAFSLSLSLSLSRFPVSPLAVSPAFSLPFGGKVSNEARAVYLLSRRRFLLAVEFLHADNDGRGMDSFENFLSFSQILRTRFLFAYFTTDLSNFDFILELSRFWIDCGSRSRLRSTQDRIIPATERSQLPPPSALVTMLNNKNPFNNPEPSKTRRLVHDIRAESCNPPRVTSRAISRKPFKATKKKERQRESEREIAGNGEEKEP